MHIDHSGLSLGPSCIDFTVSRHVWVGRVSLPLRFCTQSSVCAGSQCSFCQTTVRTENTHLLWWPQETNCVSLPRCSSSVVTSGNKLRVPAERTRTMNASSVPTVFSPQLEAVGCTELPRVCVGPEAWRTRCGVQGYPKTQKPSVGVVGSMHLSCSSYFLLKRRRRPQRPMSMPLTPPEVTWG